MSLISIAQRETFHISFVQFDNKGYGVDLLTPESLYIKNTIKNNCGIEEDGNAAKMIAKGG